MNVCYILFRKETRMKVDEESTKIWRYHLSRNELIEVLLTHIKAESDKTHFNDSTTSIEVRGDSKEITTGLEVTVTEREQRAHDTKNDVPREVKFKKLDG